MAYSITNTIPKKNLGLGLNIGSVSTPTTQQKPSVYATGGGQTNSLMSGPTNLNFGSSTPKITYSPLGSPSKTTSGGTSGVMTTGGTTSSGAAAYKGVPLIGTNQKSLQDQMRVIDASKSGATTASMIQPTKTSTPATAPTKGLLNFSSLLGGLSGASQPSSTQKGLISDLQQTAAGNKRIGEDARNISDMYSKEIKRVGNLGAGAQAGYLSTGSNVVGAGNAAIASQSVSQRMAALSDAQQAALEGTAQQFTGQNQQASALNQALGAANTQQSTGVTGLSSAAGLASPYPTSYGQTAYDPLSGFGGGQGNLDPQTAASQLANEVKSGRMTYDQAVQSLGYAGGAGQQFLNTALQGGGGYNIPFGQANLAGQASALQNLPALEGADVAAEGVKNKINAYLSNNPSLNPSELAAGNILTQWIQGKQLADPKYQTLFNYLNEYTNTLAPILGVGGEPTNLKTQIAQDFINAAATGGSIAEVLENMHSLSRGKINDLRSGYTGGGVVSSATGGGTGSGGLYDF